MMAVVKVRREVAYRVLIVGASVSREGLPSVLERSGFEVITASSSSEGLRKLEEAFPNLVIIEDGSPQLGGLKACSQIRELVDIPLILIGSESEKRAYPQAVEAGADFYMSHPVSSLELVARAKALLRPRSPPRNKGSPGKGRDSPAWGEEVGGMREE